MKGGLALATPMVGPGHVITHAEATHVASSGSHVSFTLLVHGSLGGLGGENMPSFLRISLK